MKFSTWYLEALAKFYEGEPTLPEPPFQLYSHIRVLDVEAYAVLEMEVRRAIAHFDETQKDKPAHPGPRYASGALFNDLKRLYELSLAMNPEIKHTCHAHGCETAVEPRMLMCPMHWRMVPSILKQLVWDNYRPGQERDKNPSAEYLAAAKGAIAAVREKEQKLAEKVGAIAHAGVKP